MPRFLVAVPVSLMVEVDAASAEDVSEEMVTAALFEQHGKYAEIDIRNAGTDSFEVLDDA